MSRRAMMVSPAAGGGGGTNGFTAFKTVTIDHTKVGSTDHTDFPVLISGTYTYLKTIANSGSVTSSGGYDIRPCSDAGLTSGLDFQLVNYVPTTGFIEMYVRVPTVSHTSDTVIYLGYGKSSITTDGSTTATWNSGFKAVYHFGSSSSLVLTDSTTNGLTLTNSGVTNNTGQVGGGANVVTPSGAGLLSHADDALLRLTAAFTIEVWINAATNTGYRTILEKSDGTSFTYYIDLETSTNKPRVLVTQSGSFKVITSGAGLSIGTYAHVSGTFDGTTLRLFKNGVADGTLAVSGASDGTTGILSIASDRNIQNFFQGTLDEIRISSAVRSVDWLLATFNNIASPSTFYALT